MAGSLSLVGSEFRVRVSVGNGLKVEIILAIRFRVRVSVGIDFE